MTEGENVSDLNLMPIGSLFNLEKGSLQSSKCETGEYTFITAAEEWKNHNEYTHECEALIFAAAASGSLGRIHYINDKFISSDLCFILTPKDQNKYPINLWFYYFVFNLLREDIVKNTKSGTSKESINQTNFKKYKLPYFNIDKQNLWIDKLISAKSIKENLESEITNQQSILKQLKQTILQEAIEGKLTSKWREQNSDIESAFILLEKIQAEKEKLIKDKKIKKQKPLPPIADDEKPFDIPENWEWCRLGDIATIKGGKRVPAGYKLLKTKTERVYIRVSDMKNGTIDDSDLHYISEEIHKQIKNYFITKDDLYMVIVGGTIGKCGIIPKKFDGMNLTENAARIILYFTERLYLLNCLQSSFGQKQFIDKTKSVGVQKMALNRFENTLMPLPPLKEQKEIVSIIEKLFAICDQLEEQINSSKENVDMLMKTVLKEAFEHGEG